MKMYFFYALCSLFFALFNDGDKKTQLPDRPSTAAHEQCEPAPSADQPSASIQPATGNEAEFMYPFAMMPVITATKVYAQVGADGGPTGPSPGDILEYTVVINNPAGADATGVNFTDTIDPNTTLVAGSLKTSVVAIDDSYSTVGNVSIAVPAGAGMLANEVNLDGDVLSVTAINTAGTQGTVTHNANGSFTFNPNPGYEGTTTFTYTVSDGTFTDQGQVSIAVTGMIWFIDDSAPAGGDGRLSAPWNTINAFNASSLDGVGDNIFVYSGTYNNSGNTLLLGQQKLIGQGAQGTLATLAGVTFSVHPPIAPAVIPMVGGTNPVINQTGNSIDMQSQNQVMGVDIVNTSGIALVSASSASAFVRDVTVSNSGGIAVQFTSTALNAIFKSISASNASHGIRLQNTTGSFEVTGTGTTDGSGGTISTIVQRGIELLTATNITLRNMTLNSANTGDAGFDGVCDEDQNTSCYAAIHMSAVNGITMNNVDVTTTAEQGINGNNVTNLVMTNCTLTGAGTPLVSNDENGIKLIELFGTCSFTGCTFSNSAARNTHIRTSSGTLNLTVNNCSFSNTAYEVTRIDCFEMRTLGTANATVTLSNSSFHRAGSKGIQCLAEGSSNFNLNITNCTVQRFGNPMAGIEVGSSGANANMNFNINNNPTIESSGEVAVLASTFTTSDFSGRVNNNANITNNNTTASTFATVRVLHEGNGQAVLEVKDNPNIASSNTDTPVGLIARVGTSAASRLDATIDNNNISNTTTTEAGQEGIILQVGQATMGTGVNTLCANVKNNDLTLPATVPLPSPAPYPRAFRARYLDPTSFFNLQGGGANVAANWTANNNTNNNGMITSGPTATFTFNGVCLLPTHAFAPTEEELAELTAPDQAAEAATPVETALAPPAETQVAEAPEDQPEVAALFMSGETVTAGPFTLPQNAAMTIVFRVTIDNPFPLGICQVSNQGTVTGSNFSNVLTDDPGVSGPANPTVTPLNIAPTITVCPSPVNTTTDDDLCTASVTFAATAVGCPSPTLTYKIGPTTITSPYNFPVGTTTVDVTASNGVMPAATCSFTVTVVDDQAPEITCVSGTQNRGTNLGNCSYTVQGSEFNPTVDENCPSFTLTNNFNNTNTLAGAILPEGMTTIIWTITDGALQTDMCTVVVNVTDDDAPTIACPMNIMVNCPTDVPAPYANLTEFTNAGGTVADNCGINNASFALINSAGNSLMFTRTYEITDVNGLKSTCAQTVTVNDMAPPVITPGTIAACYPTVAAAEAAAIAATMAVDGCAGVVTKTASTVGTCSAVITVTAEDVAGNMASTTYNTRIDNTAPTVTPGTIAACYPTVAAAEAAALAATTATDNCPGTLTETAATVGTCSAVITVTTSDGCGNSASVTYNTSIDNEGPTVTPGTIAACYPTVAAAEAAAIAATTAMDDCPSNIMFSASTVGTCSAVITVTASDACGNTASTTYNTRIDNQAPTPSVVGIASCYATVAEAEAAALAATTWGDNCSSGAYLETQESASTSGTCSAVITVATMDECGNVGTATFNTRIDNTAPTVTPGTIADCYPTVAAAEAAALAATTATDNCPGTLTETASTVGTCSAVITVTTTDGCGNSAQVTYNTRIDNTAPTVTPGTIADCYPTVAAAEAAALAATTATDNCPGTLTETAATTGTCSAVITVTTTDFCGNSASVTYNTRIDNTAPVVTQGIIAACYPTVAAAEAAALAATSATDNCPGTLTETASTVGTCSAVITVTTSDGCGNSASVTYNTSIDNAGPTVTPGTIAACYPTVAAAEAAAIAATTAMDDCPSNIMFSASTVGTCSAVITVTASDACGNTASTTYNTRIDNTAPTVTPGTIAACYPTVAAAEAAALAATTATDNCPGMLTETASTAGTCSAVITVTTTDFCGNSASVTYNTRIDNTAPIVTPGTIADCYPTVAAAEAAALAATSATDNCPGTLTETASTVGTCSAVITVTTSDGCGNSAQVTYNTRIDNTAPTVTAGTIASCYTTLAAAEAAAIAATIASDNCPGTVAKTASTVGTCSAVITVTATDFCGNSASVTYNTRIDGTAPTFTQGTLALCYPTVAAAEAAAIAATVASDNCPGAVTKTASTVGTCTAVVTVTLADGCGNTATVVYNTRIDNVGPTVTPGTIALCYPTVAAAEAAALAATTIVDDCLSTLDVDVNTVGECNATITITATDGCGNSSMTSYTTNIDGTAPMLVCKNVTIVLPPNGVYTIAQADVVQSVSDNCGIFDVTISPTTVSCDDLYNTIPVTVTATDPCGNATTCVANVHVTEGTALPAPWMPGNVGTTANGTSRFSPCTNGGSFVLSATGFSLPNSDVAHLVSQQICGDGEIIARVAMVANGGWAGITIRENLMPGSRMVALRTQLSSFVRRDIRLTPNANKSILQLSTPQVPRWLRLIRAGNVVSGFVSVDGVNWSPAFSTTISMSNCVHFGMFVESINANTRTYGTFDNVSVSGSNNNLTEQAPNSAIDHQPIDLRIFPNPTDGQVRLDLSKVNGREVNVEVFNGQGQRVTSRRIAEATEQEVIDLSDYSDGVYWFRIRVADEPPASFKVVKQQAIRP